MFLSFALPLVLAVSAAPAPPAPGTAEHYAALPQSVFCVEAESGMVLMEENADLQRPPASMVKMMLMLMVDEGAIAGQWAYDKPIQISRNAEGMGGTQVYVRTGDTHPLEVLMTAGAVASANDAAMAVAEGLWGSSAEYLKAMNARAKALGMSSSVFNSVHGLPPGKGQEFDLTSARDMALLGRECVKHPKILEWTRTPTLTFRASDGTKQSTNKLLETLPGCDGIKTGYIRAAGFCITATAERGGVRLVAVVMGDTKRGRFERTSEVLEKCFKMVRRVQPVAANAVIGKPVPVPNGVTPQVSLLSRGALQAVVRNEDVKKLQLVITAPTNIQAPVAAGAEVGSVKLVLGDTVFGETPLVADASVAPKTFWQRTRERLRL